MPPEVCEAPYWAPRDPRERIDFVNEEGQILHFDGGNLVFIPSHCLEEFVGRKDVAYRVLFVVILPGLKKNGHADQDKDYVWITSYRPNGPYAQGPLVGTLAANEMLDGVVPYQPPEEAEEAG